MSAWPSSGRLRNLLRPLQLRREDNPRLRRNEASNLTSWSVPHGFTVVPISTASGRR